MEIAGVAGTNLTEYTILLYKGSDGSSYDSINLVGLIPDQSNGFGALAFFESGIQNDSPDGLALIDGSNTVLQFLS